MIEAEASLFVANGAARFAILILPALVAKLEVKGQDELLIWIQIDLVFDVFLAEEGFSATFTALETLRALPVALRHLD